MIRHDVSITSFGSRRWDLTVDGKDIAATAARVEVDAVHGARVILEIPVLTLNIDVHGTGDVETFVKLPVTNRETGDISWVRVALSPDEAAEFLAARGAVDHQTPA